jgi:uncharacterized repeat protein (TIGR02543 family)
MNKKITPTRTSSQVRQSRGFSRIFNTMWSLVLLFIVFLAGCRKDDFKAEVIGLCPIVVSTDPMDKAVDVALNKVISATFNTPMKASTITSATFTIKQGTTPVTGVLAPTTNGTTFTFKPDVALLPFTTYTGTITTGATDTLRTAMVSDYVWTFTTIPQLTLSSSPTAGGTTAGAGTFAQGSTVTATATPAAGYTFTNWTNNGTFVSSSASYQFTMAGNRALVANFTLIPPVQFGLTLSSSPAAGGTTFGQGSYNTGTTVAAIESPNTGYTFTNWTENGTVVSTNSSYQFVLTGNRTLVANFTIIPALQFAVFLTSNPAGGGTTTGSGTYTAGTSVTVTATAAAEHTFTNWTESGNVVSTSSSYTFALNANRTLVANFAINTYLLNVTAVNGTVTKTPDQPNYNSAAVVQLTATPNAGYIFNSWGGDASGSANPLTVIMNSNKNITANFTALPAVLPAQFTSTFGAFGGSAGITNQGINTVINNGDIGTTAASTLITGFHDVTGDKYTETPLNIGNVTGRIYTAPPPPVIFGPGGPFGGTAATFLTATNGLAAANAFYIATSPANKPGGTDPGAGELGGLTLAPGVYKSAGATFNISNGDLTLDAQGNPNAEWYFQTAAGLTVGVAGPSGAKSIILKNGALAKNVYWHVGSAAVINAAGGGTMVGTIIAPSGITFSTAGNAAQTVLNGRALSLVASVTMVNTTINIPAP